MFDIQENLKTLPASPGVYIHKDALGKVIYVGKAVSLRNRVRQYFQSSKNMDAKVRAMVGHIAEFEYITCGSEMEAFILECNLIKKYRPKYNILLRDDKTYPYIKITSGKEEWPRLVKTRRVEKGGDKYFGPYSDVGAVNQMIDLLNSIYRLKQCSAQRFPPEWRPCLNYHIGKCDAPCSGEVNKEEYMERIRSATDYLAGRDKNIEKYLKAEMEKASEAMDYEMAAVYRDRLAAAQSLAEQQRVVLHHGSDMDVVTTAGEGHIVSFMVRDGKLVGRESFAMVKNPEDSNADVTASFIKLHYGAQTSGPEEILVPWEIPEREMAEEYISRMWGKKVKISVPARGERKALMDLARKDALEMSRTIRQREDNRKEREEKLAAKLGNILGKKPGQMQNPGEMSVEMSEESDRAARELYRVEAYDISNTNGVDTVGAMVVFRGSKPEKKAYRKFKVRTADGPDDYGSMQEIIYRRFQRAKEGDPGFSVLPDALLIDGGRGHVAAVTEITEAMDIRIPILGMVKDDHHRTRGLVRMRTEGQSDTEEGRFEEIDLKSDPMLFSYFGSIQEEVHRFAISYHRKLRDQGSLRSVLDEIPGIGPVKRNALLAYFGSVEKIRQADVRELEKVEGITAKLAEKIRVFFAAGDRENEQ